MIPEIYVEMNLVFDNNFDVNIISEALQMSPFKCICKKDTNINPITNEQDPGFWTVRSDQFFEYTITSALNNLMLKIGTKVDEIKHLCVTYNGEIFFDIVVSFYPGDEPEVCMDKKFLETVHYLDAEVRVYMYAQEKN